MKIKNFLLYFDRLAFSGDTFCYYTVNLDTKDILLLENKDVFIIELIKYCIEKNNVQKTYVLVESYEFLLELYSLFCKLNTTNNTFKDYIKLSSKLTGTRLRYITLTIDLNTLLTHLSLKIPAKKTLRIKLYFFDFLEETILGPIDNSLREKKVAIFSPIHHKLMYIENKLDILLSIREYLQHLENLLFPTFLQLISIFEELGISYFKFQSLASQALKLWTSLDNKKFHIKPITDSELESFIRFSYRGGLIYLNPDTTKKYINNVYHLDVISQYPTILLKPSYNFPIKISSVKETTQNSIIELVKSNTPGFVKVKIEYIRELQIPFLKRRYSNSDLSEINFEYLRDEKELGHYYPKVNESWIDIYTTIEISYAATLGAYNIKYLEGYFSSETKQSIGQRFVKKVFPYKESTKNTYIKNVLKILLNSLIGKFGQRSINEIFTISNFSLKSIEIHQKTYVHLASYTTAYARRNIHEISTKELLGKNIIYYLNTDSLFCSKLIDASLLKTKYISTKRSLGKFRLKQPLPPNQYIFLKVNNFIGKKLNPDNTHAYWITSTSYRTWSEFEQALSDDIIREASIVDNYSNNINTTSQSFEELLERLRTAFNRKA